MKAAGLLLLLSGWVIVIAAVMLLQPRAGTTIAFIAAGACIEAIGIILFFRAHLSDRSELEP